MNGWKWVEIVKTLGIKLRSHWSVFCLLIWNVSVYSQKIRIDSTVTSLLWRSRVNLSAEDPICGSMWSACFNRAVFSAGFRHTRTHTHKGLVRSLLTPKYVHLMPGIETYASAHIGHSLFILQSVMRIGYRFMVSARLTVWWQLLEKQTLWSKTGDQNNTWLCESDNVLSITYKSIKNTPDFMMFAKNFVPRMWKYLSPNNNFSRNIA